MESCTLKEESVCCDLLDVFNSILTPEKEKSSATELQTRASIVKTFGYKEIMRESIENIRLSDIIRSIIAMDKGQIEIKFHTRLVIKKDLC